MMPPQYMIIVQESAVQAADLVSSLGSRVTGLESRATGKNPSFGLVLLNLLNQYRP